MGAVYLAMSGHRELETLCVVKRLLPALASQAEHVRRFRHEADLARRLVHSNLVNTHNIGEVDGEVFLVQEFVEGQDVTALLDELAKRRRALPIPVAVHIASEIARALAYAHAFENLKLVHRDINQPNVRLTYAGEVKLLDFGIASSNLHGERSGEQAVRGKLWHLAPEQLRPGGGIDHRTDIYAVGVLLWELLTGRPVGTTRAGGNEGRTPEIEGEVMVWITRGQHQAPSAFNPDVPSDLDALVARAMHVNPDQRHPSADELRRTLMPFMATENAPEGQLSALMKEFFSPEQERRARQRLIESGRGLLVSEGGPSREMDAHVGVRAKQIAGSGIDWVKKNRAWVAPVAVGAAVGLACLAYLHTVRREPEADSPGAGSKAASVSSVDAANKAPSALTGSLPSRSGSSSSAERAQDIVRDAQSPSAPAMRAGAAALTAQGPAPLAVPSAASLHGSAPAGPLSGTVRADEPTAPAPAGAMPPTAPQAPSAGGKLDHLELGRDAFNRRDWARALAEGKAALAADGGAEAHAFLGNTLFKMGRFNEAEQAYRRATSLDPKNTLLQERLRIAHARAEQAGQ